MIKKDEEIKVLDKTRTLKTTDTDGALKRHSNRRNSSASLRKQTTMHKQSMLSGLDKRRGSMDGNDHESSSTLKNLVNDSEVTELKDSNATGVRQSQFSNARDNKKDEEWQIEDQE